MLTFMVFNLSSLKFSSMRSIKYFVLFMSLFNHLENFHQTELRVYFLSSFSPTRSSTCAPSPPAPRPLLRSRSANIRNPARGGSAPANNTPSHCSRLPLEKITSVQANAGPTPDTHSYQGPVLLARVLSVALSGAEARCALRPSQGFYHLYLNQQQPAWSSNNPGNQLESGSRKLQVVCRQCQVRQIDLTFAKDD